MGEEEDLLGKKKKPVRPPYLLEFKKALKDKSIVLYQGKHRSLADLRRQYVEKKSGAQGGASPAKMASAIYKDKKTGQYTRFAVDHLLTLKDVYNRVVRNKDVNQLGTPAELGRFMMVLEKAGTLNAFMRDLYTTTIPRLSVNLASSVKNFSEIIGFLLPMREPDEITQMIDNMLFVEKRRKAGQADVEEKSEKKASLMSKLRGAGRNKALVMSKLDNMYTREDEGIVKQDITLEKRLEFEYLFSMCSKDGKRIYEEEWMDYFEGSLDELSLKHMFLKHAPESDAKTGKKYLRFVDFSKILLPLTFQLCDRPMAGGGKSRHLTEDELHKKFHSNAVVNHDSTIWADMQHDIKRLQDAGQEDDEKTRLLKIAAGALDKFKIEEPIEVYKFGDFESTGGRR
ncbi:unnamed protein product [Amoebophrya sp. A25]|nr:unnamed protein product [Amoebophrya sp. A25]|eukprot:GSA25T00005449001.1